MKNIYEIWGGVREMKQINPDCILKAPVGEPFKYEQYWKFGGTEKEAIKTFNAYLNDYLILIDRTNNKIIAKRG